MGYTIYISGKLTVDEVKKAQAYLETEHDRSILVSSGDGYLNPLRDVAVETLYVPDSAATDQEPWWFCKTNRYEPEDTEIKRLLVGLQGALKNKLNIRCDDGRKYTSRRRAKG